MTKQIFVGFLLVCFLPHPAESTIAVTGNGWNKLSTREQDLYIVGVIDALADAVYICNQVPNTDCSVIKKIAAPALCFEGKPYEQSVAIVRKYMNETPANWHYTMPSIVSTALHEACKAGKPE
jgi:hypothetical protein